MDKVLARIVKAIEQNAAISSIELNLGGTGLKKGRFKNVVDLLAAIGPKVIDLGLDNNGFAPPDIALLVARLGQFPNLKGISLGGLSKVDQFATVIQDLLAGSHLESLRLSNQGNPIFERSLVPILCCLVTNTTLKRLDLSRNQLSETALLTLGNLARVNRTLEVICISDIGLEHERALIGFLDGCSASESLLDVPYPSTDVNDYLNRVAHDSRAAVNQRIVDSRGKLNVRLSVNRRLRTLRTPLSLRNDPVLSRLISSIAGTTAIEYGKADAAPFSLLAGVRPEQIRAERLVGLEPAIDRLRECERDPRVQARKSVFTSDSHGRPIELNLRIAEPLGKEDRTAFQTTDGAQLPSFSVAPEDPVEPEVVAMSAPSTGAVVFARPPDGAKPNLGPMGNVGELNLAFLTIWPAVGAGDYTEELSNPPHSRVPPDII
jgi:hypothetical protein